MATEPGTAVDVFEAHRAALTGTAYRVLGSWSDAEDVVQETWLKWSEHAGTVTSPRAWLTKVTVRGAIDRLRRVGARREDYPGSWLPEPVDAEPEHDPEQQAALRESLTLGMLAVMESLSPLERAVFVLREAFGWKHDDIAEMLGRTPAAVRQLDHRARAHVRERRPRFEVDEATARGTAARFLEACLGGSVEALLEVLSPEVVLVSDGGGEAKAPLRPIHGSDKVARFLLSVARSFADAGPAITFEVETVNGGPGLVARDTGTPIAVMGLDVDPAGTITSLYLVAAPSKLTRLGRR